MDLLTFTYFSYPFTLAYAKRYVFAIMLASMLTLVLAV